MLYSRTVIRPLFLLSLVFAVRLTPIYFVVVPLHSKPTPAEWKELDALLAANNTPAALAKLDALAKAHPDTPKLATLRDQLRASYVDALAASLLRANQRERVTFKQLPGLAQVQYSLLENSFKALAAAPDKDVAVKLLDDVRAFMANQPDFLTGWLLQARLALLVDNFALGLAAGINLSQLRAWETTSPETVKLLETLSAKGWLPKPSPPSLPPEAIAKP
jgi:hypothetical protein